MSEELVDTALLAPSIMAETEWHVENGANIAVLTPYTYFLTLSFDGGNYRGWQRQADASSVQQALEEKLTMIFKKFTCAHGCGRTDAGVHASFYVAHIQLQEPLSFDLKFRLNKHLPKEIVIFDVTSVDHMRHARFDASSRTYNYYLHLYPDPALHRYSSQYDSLAALDVEAMRRAVALLPRYVARGKWGEIIHTETNRARECIDTCMRVNTWPHATSDVCWRLSLC
eukprot:m.684939 g.684939  ORF g.684939 m.684939 type:complete len:227 (+) comp22834_c0_seq28:165-845(+)